MMIFNEKYQQTVSGLWKDFIKDNKKMPEKCDEIRDVIYQSWKRSKDYQVDPFEIKNYKISDFKLAKILKDKKELIEVAHYYMEKLYSFIEGTNFVITLADEKGNVIDIIGNDDIIVERTKQSSLVIGCNRSEAYTGTSGIGTSLATGMPIQILGAEHFIQPHHTYVCSAAPIRSETNEVIGCLAMIGPREVNHAHTLGMVCAAVDGIEKEIKMKKAYENIFIYNSQLQATIQSISSGIILFDRIGMITQFNERAVNILKLSPEYLKQKNIKNIIDETKSSVDLLNLTENFYDKETCFFMKSGDRIEISLSTSIIFDESQNRTGIVLIFKELQKVHKMVSLISGFTAKYTFESIIGISKEIEEIKRLGHIAAQSTSNVLILGESGTGKELIAQSIHNASHRSKGPFIAINCGSLPKGLIESELFGYEGGAFTGASKEGQPGKFELAEGGTIFLDEIGDMALDLQASLLRVIQSREIIRVGGKRARTVDVRIMAATNVNLPDQIENKNFRSDLYYRLNVFSLTIPPLRERKEDILILVNYFIENYNITMNKNIIGLEEDANSILLGYHWPGNIRELENVIERAINICPDRFITKKELPVDLIKRSEIILESKPMVPSLNNMKSIDAMEKQAIMEALSQKNGNISKVASMLNIPRRTLYRKIEKYEVEVENFRR